MATITLRLDDTIRDEVEMFARSRGTSVSEVLRAAIDELLGRKAQMSDSGAPPSMDMFQRRSLALQHEILARLERDEDVRRRHDQLIEVLNEGFTAEYSQEFIAVEPELTQSECALVWDILDMFRVLKASVEKLAGDDIAELGEGVEFKLTFSGFDLNNSREARLLGYARHLTGTERWEDLADHFARAADRGNSHMPMLATYQRMLATFQPLWKRKMSAHGSGPDAHLLSVSDLRKILDARQYRPRGHASSDDSAT